MQIRWSVTVLADRGEVYYREVRPDELDLPPAVGQKVQVADLDDLTWTVVVDVERWLKNDLIIIELASLDYTHATRDMAHYPTDEDFVAHLESQGWVADRGVLPNSEAPSA